MFLEVGISLKRFECAESSGQELGAQLKYARASCAKASAWIMRSQRFLATKICIETFCAAAAAAAAAAAPLDAQVVFSDPYMECDMNRWTSPELDEAAAELRTSVDLRLTASRLKDKFMTSCEVYAYLYRRFPLVPP